VELFLNSTSLGRRNPDQDRISGKLNHPPFTFPVNRFEAGELKAKAYINGEVVAEHSVKTPGEPAALKLNVDESGRAPKAGANDVVFVYATLTDSNGTTVPITGISVLFEAKDDAELISPAIIPTEAGTASALVRIGTNKKEITISAKTESALLTEIHFLPQ